MDLQEGNRNRLYCVPHTPQLSGTAERMNRTILERASSLLFHSKLEKYMWGEAAYTAVYLINRNPTSKLDTTPIEKWKQKRTRLTNL